MGKKPNVATTERCVCSPVPLSAKEGLVQQLRDPPLESRPLLRDLSSTQLLARAAQYRLMATDATPDAELALIRVAIRLEAMAHDRVASVH
jgi:hypothetical protein